MVLLRKLPGMPGWPTALGLRLPQKFLFLLFLSGLLTLCFGALFLLPDSSRFKRLFLPRRATASTSSSSSASSSSAAASSSTRDTGLPRSPPAEPRHASPAAPRRLREKPRARQQVQSDGRAEPGTGAAPARDTRASFRFDYERFRRSLRHPVRGRRPGEDPETRARRMKIKEMMKFAWDNYKLYALGKNELRPLTKNGHIGNMFEMRNILETETNTRNPMENSLSSEAKSRQLFQCPVVFSPSDTRRAAEWTAKVWSGPAFSKKPGKLHVVSV